jgi:hypothetical protein
MCLHTTSQYSSERFYYTSSVDSIALFSTQFYHPFQPSLACDYSCFSQWVSDVSPNAFSDASLLNCMVCSIFMSALCSLYQIERGILTYSKDCALSKCASYLKYYGAEGTRLNFFKRLNGATGHDNILKCF